MLFVSRTCCCSEAMCSVRLLLSVDDLAIKLLIPYSIIFFTIISNLAQVEGNGKSPVEPTRELQCHS